MLQTTGAFFKFFKFKITLGHPCKK